MSADYVTEVDAHLAEVRAAAQYKVCHEEVTRQGEVQPCEALAVALRYDPEERSPYPVCAYHSRGDMVKLFVLVAALAEVKS